MSGNRGLSPFDLLGILFVALLVSAVVVLAAALVVRTVAEVFE